MLRLFFPTLAFTLILSCSPRLESRFLTEADIQRIPESFEEAGPRGGRGPCYDQINYRPDTNYIAHFPVKYVRVNFHWVNSSDSTANYYGREAIEFVKGWIHACNYDLGKNNKMWLPHNNDMPVIPTRYQLALTPRPGDPGDDGIYFHFDDELCYYVHKGKNANLHKREVVNKYGVQLDTVLNIFIMPHHPDSVASKTYSAFGVGVALGNAVKVAGIEIDLEKKNFWGYRGTLNHEIGHIYGLSHSWITNDGCDDTPPHPNNCWNRESARCDTLTSNNFMDYNAMQHAWTPCQIGRVQLQMATENARPRRFLQPNWCELHEDRHIFIRDAVEWNGMKDLEGHLTIERGGSLTIRCRVSLPKDARITVRPGGKLILDGARLHNACGDQWQGIEVQDKGKLKGEVVFVGNPAVEDVILDEGGN